MHFTTQDIRALGELIEKKQLGGITLESTSEESPFCLRIRGFGQRDATATPAAEPAPQVQPEVAVEEGVIDASLQVVSAPAVGVFHFAQEFAAGQQIEAAQVVGTVESLKVPSDIVSGVSGVIESVLVEEGKGVEYGQAILEVRTDV